MHAIHYTPTRFTTGFTAIELLVGMAIVAVLATLAAPSFAALIEGWRVKQTTEELQSTLYYARSEAIKRGGQVVIQKIADKANGCPTNTSEWDCGWIVCADTNDSGTCTASDPVLQRYDPTHRLQITRSTKGGQTIKLNRWGLVSGTYVGFNIIPADKTISSPSARGVCMSSGGRIRSISSEALPCNG